MSTNKGGVFYLLFLKLGYLKRELAEVIRLMAMDVAEIERLIKSGIPDAEVWIEDLRGDGDHYAAHVVSNVFSGLSRVRQHQLVYDALQGKMGTELHALALQTGTPDNK